MRSGRVFPESQRRKHPWTPQPPNERRGPLSLIRHRYGNARHHPAPQSSRRAGARTPARTHRRAPAPRPPRARLTSADRPMVAPRSQRPRDSLTGDAFGSLEHVIVLAGELHARTNPEQRQNKQQPRLCTEDVFKAKLSAAGVWRRHTSANIKLPA